MKPNVGFCVVDRAFTAFQWSGGGDWRGVVLWEESAGKVAGFKVMLKYLHMLGDKISVSWV
ncbi:hypothetical protein MKW92_036657 [Papaver armeniacum]|nr:hypothetical protein MKW92_036657 [Papaver armeniacum]